MQLGPLTMACRRGDDELKLRCDGTPAISNLDEFSGHEKCNVPNDGNN